MTYSMLASTSCRNDGSSLLAIPLRTPFGGESPGRAQKTMMLGASRQMLDALRAIALPILISGARY